MNSEIAFKAWTWFVKRRALPALRACGESAMVSLAINYAVPSNLDSSDVLGKVSKCVF